MIAAKCLRILSGLFSANLIDQSSSRILTTHARTMLIVHGDWLIRWGENRPDMTLKHLTAMLSIVAFIVSLIRQLMNVFFVAVLCRL